MPNSDPVEKRPAIAPGRVAVITGAASGIGLAAAQRLARDGMKIVLADLPGAGLDRARDTVADMSGRDAVKAVPANVAVFEEMELLRHAALELFNESVVRLTLKTVIKSEETLASAQIMKYEETPPHHQYRFEAGYHAAARQLCLQYIESRR